jgi:hypothetical protein
MKKYSVYVSQSFSNYVEIEAESEEQAKDLVFEQIESGEIDPMHWDGDIFTDTAEEITA